MAPTLTDYLHGLRRLWWIPLLALVVGLGLGMFVARGSSTTTETRGTVLFTFTTGDPGQDSAAAARIAESQIAGSRLASYVAIARGSQQVTDLLTASGIDSAPTTFSTTGTFRIASARVLIAPAVAASSLGEEVLPGTGLVEIRLRNGGLSQAEADQLVTDLAEEVAHQALATDAQQVTQSLRPDPLIAQPQALVTTTSRALDAVLPVMMLTLLGFGLVYLVVWRQGLAYSRRGIEERLGARVLGDLSGRQAEAHAVTLALVRGRDPGTRALILPVQGAGATGEIAEALAAAGQGMGLSVARASIDQSLEQRVRSGAPDLSTDAGWPSGSDLTLVEASDGLDENALRVARSVDVVALVVAYGRTSYRDLTTAGRTVADVTDADIAVIGTQSARR